VTTGGAPVSEPGRLGDFVTASLPPVTVVFANQARVSDSGLADEPLDQACALAICWSATLSA